VLFRVHGRKGIRRETATAKMRGAPPVLAEERGWTMLLSETGSRKHKGQTLFLES
jgi:hypothetical protein